MMAERRFKAVLVGSEADDLRSPRAAYWRNLSEQSELRTLGDEWLVIAGVFIDSANRVVRASRWAAPHDITQMAEKVLDPGPRDLVWIDRDAFRARVVSDWEKKLDDLREDKRGRKFEKIVAVGWEALLGLVVIAMTVNIMDSGFDLRREWLWVEGGLGLAVSLIVGAWANYLLERGRSRVYLRRTYAEQEKMLEDFSQEVNGEMLGARLA